MSRAFQRSLTSALVSAVVVATVVLAPLSAAGTPPIVYHDEWPVLAADSFTRTSTDSWGNADSGGTWEHTGSTTNFKVNGSAGTVTVAKGATLSSVVKALALTDTDVTVSLSADKLQTGTGNFVSVIGRRVGTVDLGTKLRLKSDSTVSFALLDGTTSIGNAAVQGTFGIGTKLMVRTQVVGTGPTTIRTKVWFASTSEPAAWMLEGVASASAATQAGTVGVSAYLSGSVTNSPLTFAFDDFSLRPTKPVQVGNYVPTAAFTSAVTDLSATFDGSTSTDLDGTIASYAWTFGDGTTGTGASVSHTYATAGSKSVTLTVTDNQGVSGSTTSTIVATEPNKPPKAAIVASNTNLTAVLDGSTSTDSDGTITSYAWTFGDGTTGAGVKPSHAYASAGTYPVTLTVTDDDGATASASTTVTVKAPNKPPTARFTTKTAKLVATFDGTGSTDPDGTLATYAWAFGDGSTGSGATISHTYATPGTYTVTLTVTDNEGATNQAVSTVAAPTIVTFASDSFAVARATGWGYAVTGGAWSHIGDINNYSVSGGAGRQVVPAAGGTRTSELVELGTTDADLRVTVALDKPQTGGGTNVSLWGRKIGNLTYGARVKFTSDGVAALAAMEGSTALKSFTIGQYAPGSKLNLRVQVTGVNPTTINAKAWKVGTAEPATWQATATSSTAGLQSAGTVGVSTYVSSSATTIPMTVSFSSFSVLSEISAIGGPTGPPPIPDIAGMPNAATTGVPDGTVITKVVEGDVDVTVDGTVMDGWDIRGYVTIHAKNVVLRNSYVRGKVVVPAGVNSLVVVPTGPYSLTVEDSTLLPQTKSPNVDGVRGMNFTLRRDDISNVIDPVHIYGSNVLIEDSWLHDNAHYLNDPNWQGGPSHSDSVQIQEGSNLTIRHSTLTGSHNAAFMITQGTGPISNLSITGNFLDGGACTINVKDATPVGRGAPTAMSVVDNVFGRDMSSPGCAIIIPAAYPLDLRGNTYYDNGATVTRTNG